VVSSKDECLTFAEKLEFHWQPLKASLILNDLQYRQSDTLTRITSFSRLGNAIEYAAVYSRTAVPLVLATNIVSAILRDGVPSSHEWSFRGL
jgi:hypothetical protein